MIKNTLSKNVGRKQFANGLVVCCVAIAMAGCLEDVPVDAINDSADIDKNFSLAGSVGDGTASDATVTVLDGNGEKIAEGQTDGNAAFSFSLPKDVLFPLQVEAVGGNGVLGQAGPQFVMKTMVFDDTSPVVNVSPMSTLAFETSRCSSGAETESKFSWAMDEVVANLGMGYDSGRFGNPAFLTVDNDNIVPYAVANIAIFEATRRAHNALAGSFTPATDSDILRNLACDLADGSLDGVGTAVNQRVIITYLAASASVLIELGAHQLRVDGIQAASLIDSGVQSVLSDSSGVPSASSLLPSDIYSVQANKSLQVSRFVSSDISLVEYLIALEESGGAALSSALVDILSPTNRATLESIPWTAALSSSYGISSTISILQQIDDAPNPDVSLSPDSRSVQAGTSVELNWSSQNTDRCLAKGDWSGEIGTAGSMMSAPINFTSVFDLGCVGYAGATTSSTVVSVVAASDPPPNDPPPNDPPPPSDPPQISLAATPQTVLSGENVSLYWSVSGADACTASGDWSGDKPFDGPETVGPLTERSTFTLSCSNANGSSQESVSVSVTGSQGEYARGVPYPDFGWNPLTFDPPTTSTTSSLPSSVNSGEVILYTGTRGGTVRFNCNEAAPCVLKGQGQTLSSGLQVTGSHFVVENFQFYNIDSSIDIAGTRSNPASFAVIRNLDHGGNNTGTNNSTAMWLADAHDVVFYKNKIHNLKQDSGSSEVDYIGFVPRHNATNIWYLDNDVWRLGGDAIRTGTNVSRLGSGNSPPKYIYIAGNRFHDMGENPIDLKYATEIVISENELYGAQSSVSSSGELITIHESGDNVYIYDNTMYSGSRGVVTATSGGGARYIEVDGNNMSNLSEYGVYNRGGGHADVTNNTFTNVRTPIQTNSDNGSTTYASGNTFN